jgi:RNA polymerase sigma-70 factor (ECF subfamily)
MEEHQRDEWLMAEVRLGQRHSLEALIRRYATPLLTFIRRMIGDGHRSEELFQEVFLAVWNKRRLYEFPRQFKSWLFAIAVNKCRASFRHRVLPTVDFHQDNQVAAPMALDPSPADRAIATETAAIVTEAVTRLPPQQRMVIVLRIWNGLSYDEIADIAEVTPATVRSHMHHALAALRKTLDPHLAQT